MFFVRLPLLGEVLWTRSNGWQYWPARTVKGCRRDDRDGCRLGTFSPLMCALVLCVGKDLLLSPATRAVFRPPAPPVPPGRAAGSHRSARAVAYVPVNGVLWSAEVRAREIDTGSDVIVRDAEGADASSSRSSERRCRRRLRAPAPSA